MEIEYKGNMNTLYYNSDVTTNLIKENQQFFLGVRVDNIEKETALSAIKNFLFWRNSSYPKKVFFTNVHTIQLGRIMPEYKNTINNADIVLPDGSGIALAGKIFSKPIKENLNGTDFTPLLLKEAEKEGWSVFLLGAKTESLNSCVSNIKQRFPRLRIAGYHSGYFNQLEVPSLIDEISASKPDILLVAMGSPMQEMFIEKAAPKLNAAVCLAVGGLFDFLSGDKKRAPLWMRKFGIEWVFRFFQDPKTKWNRIFIEIPNFILIISMQRVQQYLANTFRNLFPKVRTGKLVADDK